MKPHPEAPMILRTLWRAVLLLSVVGLIAGPTSLPVGVQASVFSIRTDLCTCLHSSASFPWSPR